MVIAGVITLWFWTSCLLLCLNAAKMFGRVPDLIVNDCKVRYRDSCVGQSAGAGDMTNAFRNINGLAYHDLCIKASDTSSGQGWVGRWNNAHRPISRQYVTGQSETVWSRGHHLSSCISYVAEECFFTVSRHLHQTAPTSSVRFSFHLFFQCTN